MKKRLSLIVLLLAAVLMLSGCAKEEKAAASLYVNVIDNYVFDDACTALSEELTGVMPNLSVLAVSTGDTEKDPMGAMAGMARMGGLMASGEMELMICDAENARRHGANGESYIPVDELFTKEEQAELGIRTLCIPLSDDEGVLTGEMSVPCGIDLSGCGRLTEMLLSDDFGAYVVVNSKNTENAKTVIRHLLTMK